MITVEFVIYGGVHQDTQINAAREFVNAHMATEVTSTVTYLGETPALTDYGTCSFLRPENLPESDIALLNPRLPCAYIFMWQTPGVDVCWGGGNYGLAINGRPFDSIPYNVWWWNTASEWGHKLTSAAAIIIHELHHTFESILHDILGYPLAMSRSEHIYGTTVPHMDHLSDFDFTDHYEWSAWAYHEISPEMCTAIESFCGAIPPHH
ncbi:MAG TPA: hypothetical protein ENN68_01005 [Methanomicrobia archaeon]|nr:hypothetical protein [Methanomicrobia archaeon]